MDHIPLPKDPISPPDRVLCVCSDRELYDGDDFATYPVRANCPELIVQNQVRTASQDHRLDGGDLEKHQKVFQAWVFFGLLHRMLFSHGLYDAYDYIQVEKETSQRIVHTKKLEARLQQWHDIVSQAKSDRRSEIATEMRTCLQIAQNALVALNTVTYREFDRMILQSLAAICEAIEGALRRCLDSNPSAWTAARLGVPLNQDAKEAMLRNGWCISEIASAEREYSIRVSGLWYIQHMRRPQLSLQHSDCDEEQCHELQIRPETYEPQHVNTTCNCQSLGPNVEAISAILQQSDDYPILDVSGDSVGKISVKVHSAKSLPEDAAYVAISHIWADGLGNPQAMVLPQCQLLRLRQLITGIEGRTFLRGSAAEVSEVTEERRLMLWCDSLCCPVEADRKMHALSKMRAIYENAAYGLVLDRGLECFSYTEIGLLEAGTRILLSRWMRRLWTYQEAGLPRRLLVQFADKPADLIQIMRDCGQSYNASPTYEPLYSHVIATCVTLRAWLHAEPRTAWIKDVARGLCYRDVSLDSDEPICIATVLGLDSERMAKVAEDQRMTFLWRLISQSEHSVAESVIFNTLSRLPIVGYRWAPLTFRQSIKRQFDMVTVDGDTKPGVLTARGLRVSRPGWRIRREQAAGNLPETFWQSTPGTERLLPVRHPDGSCYNVFQAPNQGLAEPGESSLQLLGDSSKEWFIILQKYDLWDYTLWTSQQNGVLVSLERHESGLPYYRSRMLVYIDRTNPAYELPRQADYIYSDSMRRSWTIAAWRALVAMEWLYVKATAWLPETSRSRALSMMNRTFTSGGQAIGKRLRHGIVHTMTEAPKLSKVAKLIENAKNKDHTVSLGGQIIHAFMGRYATIDEVFGPSTTWHVD